MYVQQQREQAATNSAQPAPAAQPAAQAAQAPRPPSSMSHVQPPQYSPPPVKARLPGLAVFRNRQTCVCRPVTGAALQGPACCLYGLCVRTAPCMFRLHLAAGMPYQYGSTVQPTPGMPVR